MADSDLLVSAFEEAPDHLSCGRWPAGSSARSTLAAATPAAAPTCGMRPPASSPPPSMTWAAQESSASIHPGWQHPRRRRRQRPCPPKEHEEMTKNAARLPKQPPDDPPRGSASPRQRLHGTSHRVCWSKGHVAMKCRLLETSVWWVCIAPLAVPVVPEV